MGARPLPASGSWRGLASARRTRIEPVVRDARVRAHRPPDHLACDCAGAGRRREESGSAGRHRGGGHFWVYLQYVLGLRQLGCDVYWLEAFRTKGRAERETAALATFRARMEQHGLGGKVILYVTHSKEPSPEAPTEYLDMTRAEAEAIFERADLLVNFHYATSPGLLAHFRRTAMIDIDPGLLQFWISRKQLSVPLHDFYFTIGENVGKPGGKIPNGGLDWIHIRPAVCLEAWPYRMDPRSEAFTTISSWDSSDWLVDGDETYEN